MHTEPRQRVKQGCGCALLVYTVGCFGVAFEEATSAWGTVGYIVMGLVVGVVALVLLLGHKTRPATSARIAKGSVELDGISGSPPGECDAAAGVSPEQTSQPGAKEERGEPTPAGESVSEQGVARPRSEEAPSPAEWAGDDRYVAVNGQRVATFADVRRAILASTGLTVHLMDDEQNRFGDDALLRDILPSGGWTTIHSGDTIGAIKRGFREFFAVEAVVERDGEELSDEAPLAPLLGLDDTGEKRTVLAVRYFADYEFELAGYEVQDCDKASPAPPCALLSDRARQLAAGESEPKGFWSAVRAFAGLDKPEVVQGKIDPDKKRQYVEDGYEPFCRIQGFNLLVRVTEQRVEYVLFTTDDPMQVETRIVPGRDPSPDGVALLVVMYMAAVRDDFEIDGAETLVLLALARLLKTGKGELDLAKRLVMTLMLTGMAQDKEMSDREKGGIAKLRTALNISPEDTVLAAVATLMPDINNLMRSGDITQGEIASIVQLARAMGVTRADIHEELSLLEDRIFIQECRKGNLPTVDNPPVNLRRNEKAHFVAVVTVKQQTTETRTHRGYVGTRVRIGKLPVYFGGSSPYKTTEEVIKTIGSGTMVITNKRVVLVGTKLNYTIRVASILAIERFRDGIQIQSEGRYGGRFYILSTPQRAAVVLEAVLAQQE